MRFLGVGVGVGVGIGIGIDYFTTKWIDDNDPSSWRIIPTSTCYQSDNPSTDTEFDNDSDSDSELIKNDGCCKCEVRKWIDDNDSGKLTLDC